ncbi:theronine dehydrogenase [Inquilinus sp.]|jgi:hypothetical protein|uniref:theronine dehydrogenase n=1 Tax=Inquilinus sp. TaxID=1932117 RepID=UPI0037845332
MAPSRWRYSLRWGNRWTKPTGDLVLASAEVPAGAECPAWIEALHVLGGGYAIGIDFLDPKPIRRWSQDAKAAARRRNLRRRLETAAPLFADLFEADELARRPDYFAGEP